MANLLADPPRTPLIAPSILAADFANLESECRSVLEVDDLDGCADLLHIDVMDGHFVPNLTMGPALVASLRRALPDAFLDVHLMVTDPGQYLASFAEAGANHVTFQLEPALDQRSGTGMSPLSQGYDPTALVEECHNLGMSAGLAINPDTAAEPALELIARFDLVLIMSVHPGFAGQKFIPQVLEKAAMVREVLGPRQRLEMDGGIGPDNAEAVRDAGCDVLVAASAVFGTPAVERPGVIRRLRGG